MRSFPIGFTTIGHAAVGTTGAQGGAGSRTIYPGDTVRAGGISHVLSAEERFLVIADPQGDTVRVTFNATLVGELLPEEREELCASLEKLSAMIRGFVFR